MSDERWLRERLARAVPDPPVDRDRAPAARRRHARAARVRAAGLAAASVIVIVVVAVAVPVVLGRGGGTPPTASSSDSASSPTTSAGPIPTCPAKPIRTGDTGFGSIPQGAYAVRLCQGPGTKIGVPRDALTSGIPELIDVIDALPIGIRSTTCPTSIGPGFALVFSYLGRTRTVIGQEYGCEVMQVGSTKRPGAPTVLRRFAQALTTQRSTEAAPGSDVRPTCAADRPDSAVADPTQMVRAVVCFEPSNGMYPRPIDSADLQIVLANYRTASTPPGARSACPGPVEIVNGVTAWGDRVSIVIDCGRYDDGGRVSAAAWRALGFGTTNRG